MTPDPWMLDEHGRGVCPLCDREVRGEAGTTLTYWHQVVDCRDRLAAQKRDLQRQLRDMLARALA